MVGTVIAASASVMAQQPSDVRLDVNLKDADMVTATRLLFNRTGVQVIFKPGNKPFQRITMKVDNVTAEDAIRYICDAAGAFFTRDENGVYIISSDPPAAPEAPAVAKPKALPIVRAIPMQFAKAQDTYDFLVYNTAFDSIRGFQELKRFTRLSTGDQNRIFGTDNIDVYGSNVQHFDVSNVTPSAPITNTEAGNDVQLPGESANQMRGGGGGGQLGGNRGGGGAGGFGGQTGGGAGTGGGGLGGGGGQASLVGGQGLVPDGIDFISYDPTTNSLIVRANDPEAIERLRSAIALFDVAPQQVQIKVEFISVADDLNKSLGFEFQYQRGGLFAGERPGSFASTANPIYLNWSTGNFALRLRAALSESNSKVESAPIIRTLNNMPAAITSFVNRPIITTTTTLVNGAGSSQGVSVQYITAGISLSVAPRINADDTVTVYLTPTVGGFQGNVQSPDGNVYPITQQQAVQVVARVKNNETMVLGGFTTKNEQETITKVPVLADLPLVGQFFKSTSRSKSNSELLIFVTPTIIRDDTVTGSVSPR